MSNEETFDELKSVYDKMPETVGCVSCGKCCKIQHPHCYFVEFLYMYDYVTSNWSAGQINELVISCVERYLSNDTNKPCVFLTKENKCKIYDRRDYNCRAFGIIPKKAYAQRVKEVKKNFSGIRLGLEKQSDCCGDVKPEVFIGINKLDELFLRIYKLDQKIGVSSEDLKSGNSYMTFHDHFLLFLYGSEPLFLKSLTEIKRSGSEKDKKLIIEQMRKEISL